MIGLSVGLMADFVRDAGMEIVTDNATGLQWQDDTAPVTMPWQNAINYCEALNFSSKQDWRLPNINELNSLINDSTNAPAISSTFVNTASGAYWSSTTVANKASYAWGVYFHSGYQYGDAKTVITNVRCVRAGQ